MKLYQYHDIHQYLEYENTEGDMIIDTSLYKSTNYTAKGIQYTTINNESSLSI